MADRLTRGSQHASQRQGSSRAADSRTQDSRPTKTHRLAGYQQSTHLLINRGDPGSSAVRADLRLGVRTQLRLGVKRQLRSGAGGWLGTASL